MRSATIKIDPRLLFNLIGLKNLYAEIDDIGINDGFVVVCLSGEDGRLPEADHYPDCAVIVQVVTAHLEEIGTSNPKVLAPPLSGGSEQPVVEISIFNNKNQGN